MIFRSEFARCSGSNGVSETYFGPRHRKSQLRCRCSKNLHNNNRGAIKDPFDIGKVEGLKEISLFREKQKKHFWSHYSILVNNGIKNGVNFFIAYPCVIIIQHL